MMLYSLAAPSQKHTAGGLAGLRGTKRGTNYAMEFDDEDVPVRRGRDGAKTKRQQNPIKRAGQQRLMQTLEAVNQNAEEQYDQAVQSELEEDFPELSADTIQATLEDNNYNFDPAFEDLEEVVEDENAAAMGNTCVESSEDAGVESSEDAEMEMEAQLVRMFPELSP